MAVPLDPDAAFGDSGTGPSPKAAWTTDGTRLVGSVVGNLTGNQAHSLPNGRTTPLGEHPASPLRDRLSGDQAGHDVVPQRRRDVPAIQVAGETTYARCAQWEQGVVGATGFHKPDRRDVLGHVADEPGAFVGIQGSGLPAEGRSRAFPCAVASGWFSTPCRTEVTVSAVAGAMTC